MCESDLRGEEKKGRGWNLVKYLTAGRLSHFLEDQLFSTRQLFFLHSHSPASSILLIFVTSPRHSGEKKIRIFSPTLHFGASALPSPSSCCNIFLPIDAIFRDQSPVS